MVDFARGGDCTVLLAGSLHTFLNPPNLSPQKQHLSGFGIFSVSNAVEVNPAGNLFASVAFSIPIYCLATRSKESIYQRSHPLPQDVENLYSYRPGSGEREFYGGRGIEWVWIVEKQSDRLGSLRIRPFDGGSGVDAKSQRDDPSVQWMILVPTVNQQVGLIDSLGITERIEGQIQGLAFPRPKPAAGGVHLDPAGFYLDRQRVPEKTLIVEHL
jgi:hypothetical protein